jgi:hypothetical protein
MDKHPSSLWNMAITLYTVAHTRFCTIFWYAARESSIARTTNNVTGITAHRNNFGRFHCDVCAGADRNSNVRRGQRWRIVHVIADHCHSLAAGLELLPQRLRRHPQSVILALPWSAFSLAQEFEIWR